MSPIRIIGIGSPFGEDQIGWQAVDGLAKTDIQAQFASGLISILSSDRPGAKLLEHMHGAKMAILIDAMQAGLRPGSIKRVDEHEIETDEVLLSSHGYGIGSAIKLGRALDSLPDKIVIYGIEIGTKGIAGSNQTKTTDISAQTMSKLTEMITHDINGIKEIDYNAIDHAFI